MRSLSPSHPWPNLHIVGFESVMANDLLVVLSGAAHMPRPFLLLAARTAATEAGTERSGVLLLSYLILLPLSDR